MSKYKNRDVEDVKELTVETNEPELTVREPVVQTRVPEPAPSYIGTHIYVGPSIPGVVRQNQLFSNGPTKELAGLIKTNASVRNLFIPTSRNVDAQKQIAAKSGSYYTFYMRVKEGISHGL